jgi:hypothetical protein
MITKNFRTLCSMMLLSLGSNSFGMLPVVGANGTTYYAGAHYYTNFPRSVTTSLALSATTAGIVLGTGTTSPTADDTRIETPITSGLTATVNYVRALDGDNNPYLEFTLVLTNSMPYDITVTEIAYNQSFYLGAALESTSTSAVVVCIDHTQLDEPVTIPAGGQNTILYRLTTIAPE